MSESKEGFSVGQIFEGEYSPFAATWCNSRGDCYIEEIDASEDGTRRFQIVKSPEPTADELEEQARQKRDSLISQTDYLLMADYPISAEDLEAVKKYRQALRDVPQQKGFPKSISWPELPAFLKE